MFSTRNVSCAIFAWLTAVSLTATAQTEKTESPAGETGATVQYQSVFSGYQGFQDPEPVSWRKANEQVAETSGHGGHDMSNMPGHDMGSMKKEESKMTKPAAEEPPIKDKPTHDMKGMNRGEMKGMNHGDMKGMENMHGKEKQ